MSFRMMVAGVVGAVLVAAACREPMSPTVPRHLLPSYAVVNGAAGITLDQQNGALGESGTLLIKGFNPTNPHHGDAVIATFYYAGSTNIIDSVADVLTTAPYTHLGNKYTLVEYVTAGGYSMATYVATNIQGFPDPNTDPGGGDILAVGAYLSQPVTDGGVTISAWSGVNSVAAYALADIDQPEVEGARWWIARRDGDIAAVVLVVEGLPFRPSIGKGSLAYGVTMSNAIVGRDPPPNFVTFSAGSDAVFVSEGDYAVPSAIGSVNPQWTWFFDATSQNNWLATVLALNPPLHLAFAVQPSTTLPLLPIKPAVQVEVLDALNNRVTTYSGQVTIAIGHNGGLLLPGTLSGTKTVTVANGVATFSDLSIDQAGNGYTLLASATNVFDIESVPFNIGAM